MSDLISRKALIKELNELRRYVPVPSYKDVFDIIMKAKSIEQPQSVADALEEAAKEIDLMVNTYIESGNKYHEVSEGRERCVNKARAAMSCAETIRAFIKLKAKGVGDVIPSKE